MPSPPTLPAGYALLPLFLGLVLVEALVLYLRARRVPDPRELLANLGTGAGQLALRPVYETLIAALYLFLYEHGRLTTFSIDSAGTWVVLFFATDLTYYAYHRMSHRVAAMWAWHGVHHQSTSYDLSISFRLSWLGGPIERLFYVPFALVGFPPAMIVALTGLSSFYQFFVHTRTIGWLGPLEWIFNTPSHHRVHHGTEPHYVDHNFGGVLCIWDRLFGTYVREQAEPTYGVSQPFTSKSPWRANTVHWHALRAQVRTAIGWRDKIATLLGPPRASDAIHEVSPAPRAEVLHYVAAQLAIATLLTLALVGRYGALAPSSLASVALTIAGAWSLGALLDGVRWAPTAETGRLTVAAITAGFTSGAASSIAVLVAALSLTWLALVTRRGTEPVIVRPTTNAVVARSPEHVGGRHAAS